MNRPPYLRQSKLPPMVNKRALDIANLVLFIAAGALISLFVGLVFWIIGRSLPSAAEKMQERERIERADAVNKLVLEEAASKERQRKAALTNEIISEWKKLQQLKQLQ